MNSLIMKKIALIMFSLSTSMYAGTLVIRLNEDKALTVHIQDTHQDKQAPLDKNALDRDPITHIDFSSIKEGLQWSLIENLIKEYPKLSHTVNYLAGNLLMPESVLLDQSGIDFVRKHLPNLKDDQPHPSQAENGQAGLQGGRLPLQSTQPSGQLTSNAPSMSQQHGFIATRTQATTFSEVYVVEDNLFGDSWSSMIVQRMNDHNSGITHPDNLVNRYRHISEQNSTQLALPPNVVTQSVNPQGIRCTSTTDPRTTRIVAPKRKAIEAAVDPDNLAKRQQLIRTNPTSPRAQLQPSSKNDKPAALPEEASPNTSDQTLSDLQWRCIKEALNQAGYDIELSDTFHHKFIETVLHKHKHDIDWEVLTNPFPGKSLADVYQSWDEMGVWRSIVIGMVKHDQVAYQGKVNYPKGYLMWMMAQLSKQAPKTTIAKPATVAIK